MDNTNTRLEKRLQRKQELLAHIATDLDLQTISELKQIVQFENLEKKIQEKLLQDDLLREYHHLADTIEVQSYHDANGEDIIYFSIDVRIGDISFQCNSEWISQEDGDIGKETITFGSKQKKFLSTCNYNRGYWEMDVQNFEEVRSITNASSPEILGRLMKVLQLHIGHFEDNIFCHPSWEDYFSYFS